MHSLATSCLKSKMHLHRYTVSNHLGPYLHSWKHTYMLGVCQPVVNRKQTVYWSVAENTTVKEQWVCCSWAEQQLLARTTKSVMLVIHHCWMKQVGPHQGVAVMFSMERGGSDMEHSLYMKADLQNDLLWLNFSTLFRFYPYYKVTC